MIRSFSVSRPVRSLVWNGDDLVDIAAGWRRWRADGRHLLSAGWLWHPVGTVEVYDLVAALDDPTMLDQRTALWEQLDAGVEAACWLDSDRLLASGHPDEEPIDGDDASLLAPGELGVWSLTRQAWTPNPTTGAAAATLAHHRQCCEGSFPVGVSSRTKPMQAGITTTLASKIAEPTVGGAPRQANSTQLAYP
jgi:hypothetical protein